MTQEITANRTLPANLQAGDEALFSSSLQVTFTRQNPLILRDCWILEDSVFEPKILKFHSSHTHIAKLGPIQFAKRIVYSLPKKWRRIPKAMWVTDEWSANYFHWMTDCLPRIWEGLELSSDFPILLPESYKKLGYVTQSLEVLGIPMVFYKKNENLKIDHLILTARTATFPNFQESLVLQTRERMAFTPAQSPRRKVYISRKMASKRKAHNEQETEDFLKARGYEIAYAEKMTVAEQIQLMSETRILVCLHGAALTNMIFLPQTSRVMELRNVGDSGNQCFFNLASALGLSYYYTLHPGDHKDTIMTDFTIDLKALEEGIEQIEF